MCGKGIKRRLNKRNSRCPSVLSVLVETHMQLHLLFLTFVKQILLAQSGLTQLVSYAFGFHFYFMLGIIMVVMHFLLVSATPSCTHVRLTAFITCLVFFHHSVHAYGPSLQVSVFNICFQRLLVLKELFMIKQQIPAKIKITVKTYKLL